MIKPKSTQPMFVHGVLDDAQLPASLFRIYGHVTRRAGKKGIAFGSVFDVAKKCRLNHETARSGLQLLVDYHMITRTERPGRTTEYRISDMADWQIPLGKEGMGNPSESEVGHPSQTRVDKVYPAKVATATAAGIEIDLATWDSVAFPAGLAPAAAPLSNAQWVNQGLTMLELKRLEKTIPMLTKLELWHIAEVHGNWVHRKLQYENDIAKARKSKPDQTLSDWFAFELQAQRGGHWQVQVEDWKRFNIKPDPKVLAARDARQLANDIQLERDYRHDLLEGRNGTPHTDVAYHYSELVGLATTWATVSAWERAVISRTYRAAIIQHG